MGRAPRSTRHMQDNWSDDLGDWNAHGERVDQNENKIDIIYHLSSQPIGKEIIVAAAIGSDEIKFLPDTGAAVSTVNIRETNVARSCLEMVESVPKSSGRDPVKDLGVLRAWVRIGERTGWCDVCVVGSHSVARFSDARFSDARFSDARFSLA